jgi:hypothetical protein
MVCRRLSLLALAGSLSLAVGCHCMSDRSSSSRFSRGTQPACCEPPICDGGGVVTEGGPIIVPIQPGNGTPMPPPSTTFVPQPAPATVTPVPGRLVPQPQVQSQPQAYRP